MRGLGGAGPLCATETPSVWRPSRTTRGKDEFKVMRFCLSFRRLEKKVAKKRQGKEGRAEICAIMEKKNKKTS